MLGRLWQWLRALWGPPLPLSPEEKGIPGLVDHYTPQERRIYAYFDGEKTRRVDPLVLWRKVMEKYEDFKVEVKVAFSPSKDAAAAWQQAVGRIRLMFDVKPWDEATGAGLTEDECFDLIDHFTAYMDALKKGSSPMQTSAEETSGVTASTSAANPPTSNTSASGPTANAPSTATPELSTTEPPLPSVPLTSDLSSGPPLLTDPAKPPPFAPSI